MNWWHSALYDTSSLITVDKMFLDDESLGGNVALILKELVETRRLTPDNCDRIFANLDARQDAIIPRPQTWARLKVGRFP